MVSTAYSDLWMILKNLSLIIHRLNIELTIFQRVAGSSWNINWNTLVKKIQSLMANSTYYSSIVFTCSTKCARTKKKAAKIKRRESLECKDIIFSNLELQASSILSASLRFKSSSSTTGNLVTSLRHLIPNKSSKMLILIISL